MSDIQWRKSSFSQGNGNCVSVGWAKSSFSNGASACVETRRDPDGDVFVRDTKLGDASPVLRFTPAEFDAWVKGCAAGEFDL
jgi:hypothetical protein